MFSYGSGVEDEDVDEPRDPRRPRIAAPVPPINPNVLYAINPRTTEPMKDRPPPRMDPRIQNGILNRM